MLRFKRGAFEALEPIQPFFIQYTSSFCNPASDVIPLPLHLLFMGCQLWSTITLRRMPVIFFSSELRHKSEGKSEVEAYSDVIRDMYSKVYGIQKVDNSLMEKVKLNEYIYSSKEKYE